MVCVSTLSELKQLVNFEALYETFHQRESEHIEHIEQAGDDQIPSARQQRRMFDADKIFQIHRLVYR